jgi:hypothetical protein
MKTLDHPNGCCSSCCFFSVVGLIVASLVAVVSGRPTALRILITMVLMFWGVWRKNLEIDLRVPIPTFKASRKFNVGKEVRQWVGLAMVHSVIIKIL